MAVKRGVVRIIGGQWRGRKIHFPARPGLRPSGDRIRETLFNWLVPYLPGSRCLDLFAGSGALGVEALSRGAEHVVFVERDREAVRELTNTIQTLDANALATVVCADALHWLTRPPNRFDILFLDPPFASKLWPALAQVLSNTPILNEQALIYCESARHDRLGWPPTWRELKHRSAGQVDYRLYRID